MPASPTVMTRCTDLVSDVSQPGGWQLVCECTRYKIKGACHHIADVMAARLDVVEVGGFPEHAKIFVPLFRNPYPLSVPVLLGPPIEPTAFREVIVTNIEPFDAEVSVGWVEHRAGRKEIRVVLVEWLHNHWLSGGDDWTCRAPQHVPGQPYENFAATIPRNMPPPAVLIDHYFIITTGNCLACATDSGIPVI